MEQNLTLKLFEQLRSQTVMSDKAKAKYGNARSYFLARQELENKIILSGLFNSIFEEATINEIEDMRIEPICPDFFDPKNLMMILIEALKNYVDNGEEVNPKAEILHRKYLELRAKFDFLSVEDGFTEYIAEKGLREQIAETRETGSICPYCHETKIKSNGTMWVCGSCGKSWRKRI